MNSHYIVKTNDIIAGSVPSSYITMNGPTHIVEYQVWSYGSDLRYVSKRAFKRALCTYFLWLGVDLLLCLLGAF